MRSGLKFSLRDGYRPLTISPSNARKCWEPEFQFALRGIAGETYPQADFELDGPEPHVTFCKVNKLGLEVLKGSKPFDGRKPSASEVHRVQGEIERLHAMANDVNIPWDRREFFRNLQLPNPQYMPECWRTTGFFRRKLHIIWGLTKAGKHSTFLPASENAESWGDKSERMSLRDALELPKTESSSNCKGETGASDVSDSGGGRNSKGRFGRVLRWLIRLALVALAISLIRGCIRGCVPRLGHGLGGGLSSGIAPKIPAKLGDGKPSEPSGDSKSSESEPDMGDKTSESVTNREATQAFMCRFKVNASKELPGSNADVACVEFSVSPVDGLKGKKFVVSDWRVNDVVKLQGESATYNPENGLRYDKTYTVSATVTVDGKPQRVEPFQWNTIDMPTWQILEVGRDQSNEMRRYKLTCCNSSEIHPIVKGWKVSFRPGGRHEQEILAFETEKRQVGDDVLEMDWGIGRYKGAYFVEMTAEILYSVRGKERSTTHVEVFPFSHDSSADGLTKAKYEVVIPNVYFCLARLQDGSLINGTAFAVSDKLLLSNYHVAVGGIPECYANSANYKVVGPVTLTNVRGKTYYAKVERSDRGRDLALLRLCDKSGGAVDDCLPGYLHLSDDKLIKGIAERSARHVFAIGYPKGTVCMGPPAFTDGKAEKLFKRDYSYGGQTTSFETILNYTSTKCGYSGGPLIDYQTETVLGVNFGGLLEKMEGHKAASFATSSTEVGLVFTNLAK